MDRPVTPDDVRRAKQERRKLACLTAYDYPTARLLDESGVDVILVGDSVGMVVLGHPDTTLVTMADMVHHTRIAARGVQRALLVADLPYHSYESPAQAVENARRLMDEGARAVKLEGGVSRRPQIEAIVSAGIQVMGHIGMLPQNVREEGGYKLKGRDEAGVIALIEDGRAVEAAGAFSIVLEIVAAAAAQRITSALAIPTIGIASGGHCDGQILVTHDLIGLFPWFTPKFVRPEAEVGVVIRDAVRRYVDRTRAG
ncbi:3-methyl-2-oxobutanoate hydroxymethyltransferase [Verrucomicrobia bacterium SCGC AG-212-E04]|nr:3-methyl-2-oxobutanoate hydroxymethyltransferase [Verrucomicrobia bacterium SCGC AG-212-E04]